MAVFNGSVNDIESKKNKVSSISENPSDEKYPSEKAVKDYVDNNSGGGGLTESEVNGKIYSALEDWTRNIQPETLLYKVGDIEGVDEGDAEFCYPNVLAVKNYVEAEFADAGANYGFEKQDNKVEAMGDASDKNVAYPTVGAVEAYVEEQIGDIETALDSIIAIQESLIGTITFTIDDVSYTALKGMTWVQWIDSKYNTINAWVEGDEVCFELVLDGGERFDVRICTRIIDEYTPVQSADTIMSNYAYYTM